MRHFAAESWRLTYHKTIFISKVSHLPWMHWGCAEAKPYVYRNQAASFTLQLFWPWERDMRLRWLWMWKLNDKGTDSCVVQQCAITFLTATYLSYWSNQGRSLWHYDLRHRPAAIHLLEMWVWILPGARLFVSVECFVLYCIVLVQRPLWQANPSSREVEPSMCACH
jgi:hypothetical protein